MDETNRVSSWTLRHRHALILMFALLSAVGLLLIPRVRVNNNLADYLPADVESARGMAVMRDAFGKDGESGNTARVMLDAVSVSEAMARKAALLGISGVESVAWLDDAADVFVPLEFMDMSITTISDKYIKDGKALFSITAAPGKTADVVDAIIRLFGGSAVIAGQAAEEAAMIKTTHAETRKAAAILLPAALFILIITTRSIAEPLIILLSIGAAVLINMGASAIRGEVSFVTSAISPVLQLAVSLDYALFLLDAYKRKRATINEPVGAMKAAMLESFVSVAGSAATAMIGFFALMFMRFGLGYDLGLNLLKGVFISFVSVMLLLPCLTLALNRFVKPSIVNDVSEASEINENGEDGEIGEGGSGEGGRVRNIGGWIALALLVALAVPSYLAQSANTYSYGGQNDSANAINELFGAERANALLIPDASPARELTLLDTLRKIEGVSGVASYADTVGASIPVQLIEPERLSRLRSGGYSRVALYTDTPAESAAAARFVENIRSAASAAYPGESFFIGADANFYDLRQSIESGAPLVSRVAMLATALALLVAFRSLSLPLMLVFTIQAAVWINLAIPCFMGSTVNYIGCLVAGTIQLGATVDYAILLTDNYRRRRLTLPKAQAIRAALSAARHSILVSSGVLVSAGIAIRLASSNAIVQETGILLARGTALSVIIVITALPALLTIFDGLIRATSVWLKHEGIGGNE